MRVEHQRQAMNHLSMGNSITSLRLCATLDWNEYVEGVSLIEQILQRDPPGVYRRMDFRSRDRYRHSVEALADPTGEAQVRVALRAIESARQAAEKLGTDSRAAHVGYHLIGPGRRELESDVAHHPPLRRRLKRMVFEHATPIYITSIALLTGIGVAGSGGGGRSVAGAVLDVDLGGRARAHPCQRICGGTHAPHGPPDRQAVAASTPRPAWRGAGSRAHHGHRARPHLLDGGRARPRRAPRGSRAGQYGPPHSLRAAHRLPGCAVRTPAGRGRGARRGDRDHRCAQRALRARRGRPVLSLPPRTPLERERGRVDGVGTQARQDRGIQSAAAGRHRHELHRPGGRSRDPAAHPVLHHARQRHAPAARYGAAAHRRHRAPPQSPALRP